MVKIWLGGIGVMISGPSEVDVGVDTGPDAEGTTVGTSTAFELVVELEAEISGGGAELGDNELSGVLDDGVITAVGSADDVAGDGGATTGVEEPACGYDGTGADGAGTGIGEELSCPGVFVGSGLGTTVVYWVTITKGGGPSEVLGRVTFAELRICVAEFWCSGDAVDKAAPFELVSTAESVF
jgi:hypothetical protein